MNHAPIELPAGRWITFRTPRVPPADRSSLGRVARAALWAVRRRSGQSADFTVFLTLARLGRIFPAHSVFLSQLLAATRLSATEKELVVLRVAWRLGCVYEYAHHHRMATDIGVPPGHIRAASSEDLFCFDLRTAALLRAADQLVSDHQLSDAGWAALTAYVSADEALELCMFVGHYVMVAGVINTAGVVPEAEFAVQHSKDRQP